MAAKGNTTWKPTSPRKPMLTNRLAGARLGVAPVVAAPIVAGLARWVLPWLAVSGGVALTSLVASKSLPEIPINKKNIGLASALIGGGGAAYFASEGLSDTYKPWAYAAAVAGIASGLYFLLQETPAPPVPSPTGGELQPENPAASCAVPPYRLEPVSEGISGIHIDFNPAQPETGSTTRSKYTEQSYVFALRNRNSSPRCFYVGLNITESDGTPAYHASRGDFPSGRSPISASPYGRQYVVLAPQGRTMTVMGPAGQPITVKDSVVMTLKAPAYTEALSWSVFPFFSIFTSVGVELFRNYQDRLPFQESASIPITQSNIG